MTAMIWAKRVRCDWPECAAEAEVDLGREWPDRTMPEGWTDLSHLIAIRQPGAVQNPGRDLREVCPEHSRATLAELAAILTPEAVPR